MKSFVKCIKCLLCMFIDSFHVIQRNSSEINLQQILEKYNFVIQINADCMLQNEQEYSLNHSAGTNLLL